MKTESSASELEQLARRTALEMIGQSGADQEATILSAFQKVQELTRKEGESLVNLLRKITDDVNCPWPIQQEAAPLLALVQIRKEGIDFDDGDTGVARSEENFDPVPAGAATADSEVCSVCDKPAHVCLGQGGVPTWFCDEHLHITPTTSGKQEQEWIDNHLLVKVADAHNSALTDEREKYVEQREDWIREIQQLREQLAAAQASIAAHNRTPGHTLDFPDTTALDAYVREQMQPLVEALEEIAKSPSDTDKWALMSIANDALAKVKEGK